MIINNNLQSIVGAYCLNSKNKNKKEINLADLAELKEALKKMREDRPRWSMCFNLDCANFINVDGKMKCSVYDEIPDKICNGGCCTSFKSKKTLKIF